MDELCVCVRAWGGERILQRNMPLVCYCSRVMSDLLSSLQASSKKHALRATPLLRVIVKFTVKNAVCMSLRLTAYGEFDCEFDFDPKSGGALTTGVETL